MMKMNASTTRYQKLSHFESSAFVFSVLLVRELFVLVDSKLEEVNYVDS